MSVHLSLFSVEAVREADLSEGFFGGPTFFLILAFIAFLVLVIVGVMFIIFRRRNLKLRNLTSLDEEKLQSNPIFQQATNYYVNPKLLGWEVPRCHEKTKDQVPLGPPLAKQNIQAKEVYWHMPKGTSSFK